MRGWMIVVGCSACVQATAPPRATVAARASTPAREAAMERSTVPSASTRPPLAYRNYLPDGPGVDMHFVLEQFDCPDDRASTWTRGNRGGSGSESLGPALVETPRAGVGVALIAHPDGRRYHFASAVRPGGFVDLGEVDAPAMGTVRRRRVAGFRYDAAVEGLAPAIAFWPDGDTLAMVSTARAGTHRLERVRLSDGLRSAIDLGTIARADSAPPALLVTPQGLIVAILHGSEAAPASAELELIAVGARAEAVTSRLRVPLPTAAPRGAATGVSLAADGAVIVVHWSGATLLPRPLRQTFLAAFDCQ